MPFPLTGDNSNGDCLFKFTKANNKENVNVRITGLFWG